MHSPTNQKPEIAAAVEAAASEDTMASVHATVTAHEYRMAIQLEKEKMRDSTSTKPETNSRSELAVFVLAVRFELFQTLKAAARSKW